MLFIPEIESRSGTLKVINCCCVFLRSPKCAKVSFSALNVAIHVYEIRESLPEKTVEAEASALFKHVIEIAKVIKKI